MQCRPPGVSEREVFLKVKLPTFQFQFQQLCVGESYSDIVELAQLRQKLPRDAVQVVAGLSSPDIVWSRLDEVYGNCEMPILTALKRVRSFKTTKTARNEQIIELVTTVQRCRTVLENLNALGDLLSDGETVAAIVYCLPHDTYEQWYQRWEPVGETHVEKGMDLLEWLEEERQNAVKVHAHALGSRRRRWRCCCSAVGGDKCGGVTAQRRFGRPSGGRPQDCSNHQGEGR